MDPTRSSFWALAAATSAVVAATWVVGTPPLGGLGLLGGAPLLLLGVYVAVASTWIQDDGPYGALLAGSPPLAHAAARTLGFVAIGVALHAIGSTPPAGTRAAYAHAAALDPLCRAPSGERVERPLLPALDAVLDARGRLPRAAPDLDASLTALAARCLPHLRDAFDDPRGTHPSWRTLRDRFAAHAELLGLPPDDPLWTRPWRAREPSAQHRPVFLGGGEGEQPRVME